MIFVNERKKARAKDILDLVNGIIIPKNDYDDEVKNKFANFLAGAKIEAKSEKAIEFVYEKLGGLLRTEEQEKEAKKRKADIKAKGKKRMVE